MKTCFKCNLNKPLVDFYKHSAMADGHLNKCKKCTTKDSEERRKLKSQDINWILSERKRHREKSKKYREAGVVRNTTSGKNEWVIRNPEKRKAHQAVHSALRSGKIHRHPCCICGNKAQAHHDDYSKPLEIIWLCSKHHGERHIEINKTKLIDSFK